MHPGRRKTVAISILILALLFLVWVVLWATFYSKFRLVSTTPELGGSIATSTSSIKLSYSKKVDVSSVDAGLIKQNSPSVLSVRVDGENIFIELESLEKDKSYRILLTNVSSVDGATIEQTVLSFKAEYIEYGKLPQSERDLQVESTNPSGIARVLPHNTDNYYAEFFDCDKDKPCIFIEMKFSVPESYYKNKIFLDRVEKYRKEAVEYIKTGGVRLEDYTLVYSEPVLLNSYPEGVYGVSEAGLDEYTGDGAPPEEQPF